MSKLLSLLLLPPLMVMLSGCAALKLGKKKAETPKAPEPSGAMTLIGIVEMVNPEQRYVLIRCEQTLGLPAGTELIALDASGAQSKLVLTPERKGLYLTADVKDGSPQVRNLVMQRRNGASGAAAAPAAAATPAALPNLSLPNPFPVSEPAQTPVLPLDPPLPLPQP